MNAIAEVGAQSGWHIEFRAVSQLDVEPKDFKNTRISVFSSSDYYASIDATLPGDLVGGSYTFVIEGMSSEDYSKLYQARDHLVADLHLYWRDAGVVGYLVDLAGLTDTLQGDDPPPQSLVAVLRVTSLKRRPGSRRYEVVIEARELVYDRLLRPIPEPKEGDGGPQAAPTSLQAAAQIALLLGVDSVSQEETLSAEQKQAGEQWSWTPGEAGIKRLSELHGAMEQQTKKFGLGMYLIRDGVLYMGPERLRLVGTTFPIGPDEGLIQIQSLGQKSEDPNNPDAAPKRDEFELMLRGRPDIKPGDFVVFNRPPDETDELGSAVSFTLGVPVLKAAAETRMYVRGVNHRLSRESGFVTLLRGVSIPSGPPGKFEGWFEHAPPKGPAMPEAAQQNDGSVGEVAGLIQQQAAKGGGRRLDVGQVRASNAKGSRFAAQTEKLWRGLVPDDGRPHAADRLAFDTNGAQFPAAPYVSPFAWGNFGLVLPRYPGMRVLLAHRNGNGDDLIDTGALWERGAAPTSNPGDYWLILPAAIPAADREEVADDQKPKAPGGKATNDLIDADGNRVIEVGTLTVRVGAASLQEAGTRPAAASVPVSIEHASGSRIAIDQDGNIVIESKKKLDLVAEDDITFDSKGNVVVKTDGIMDVKGRS
jgi:hypothetical protein